MTTQIDQTQSSILLYLRTFRHYIVFSTLNKSKIFNQIGVIHFLSQNSVGQEEQTERTTIRSNICTHICCYMLLELMSESWDRDPSSGCIPESRSNHSQRKRRMVVQWKEVLVTQFSTSYNIPVQYEWQMIKSS